MEKRNNELKKVEAVRPKKEFKIEIKKIGKLEENTANPHSRHSQSQNSSPSYGTF